MPARRHPWCPLAWREAFVDECGVEVLSDCDHRPVDDVRDDAIASLPRRHPSARPACRWRTPPCSATIVIATLDRPADLAACLARSSPTRASTASTSLSSTTTRRRGSPAVCDRFPTVRRLDEARRGLSYARNAGIVAAGGDVVVATDDDVRVPDGWLDLLLDPFRRNDVMAVCGNVQPLELGNPAQLDFERISPLSKGFQRFESRWADPIKPWRAFPAWELGATANAAFRRVVFADPEIGLLDEALGAGMPSGVGEDSYLLYRIVRAGWTVVYDPTATCGTATATPPKRWSRRSPTTTPATSPTSSRRSSETTTREPSTASPGSAPMPPVSRVESLVGSRPGATGDRQDPAPRHAARPDQLRALAAPGARREGAAGHRTAERRRQADCSPAADHSPLRPAGRPSSHRPRSRGAAARHRHDAGDPAGRAGR